ncbi:hypothetical protein [Thioalkalivibrio sp. ALE19]|nr:hypothetical protein [Thioalkalivibrio sp. ALE19]
MPKIRTKLSIGFPGATREEIIELDQDEWDECETEQEREELIDAAAQEWANNFIDIEAEVIE